MTTETRKEQAIWLIGKWGAAVIEIDHAYRAGDIAPKSDLKERDDALAELLALLAPPPAPSEAATELAARIVEIVEWWCVANQTNAPFLTSQAEDLAYEIEAALARGDDGGGA
jgi:hypothetical protein